MSRTAINQLIQFESGMIEGISPYILKKKSKKTPEEWAQIIESLQRTCTVYVGNLSFYTTESQIFEYFSQVGLVKRVIMGLNNRTYEPCGFCFVEYMDHQGAVDARMYLDGTMLDLRTLKIDIDDEGFLPGREFGKSKHTGGQIRDDYRDEYDIERGGWSSILLAKHYSMVSTTEKEEDIDNVSNTELQAEINTDGVTDDATTIRDNTVSSNNTRMNQNQGGQLPQQQSPQQQQQRQQTNINAKDTSTNTFDDEFYNDDFYNDDGYSDGEDTIKNNTKTSSIRSQSPSREKMIERTRDY